MDHKISVVIPVYNSAQVVSQTVQRVRNFFLSNAINFEVILVNDGSADDSWNVISKLAQQYDEVISINLLKNFGQHCANLCGFRASTGDYIVTMDDDLQNPPEEIAKLLAKIDDGYDLVMGKFEKKKHALHRSIGSKIVGRLTRKIFNIEKGLTLSNFRLVRRDVIDRVCEDSSFNPHIPGLLLQYSNKRCNTLVKHNAREHGVSNYNLAKLVKLVINLLFSHSKLPLRYAASFGFCTSLLIFFIGLYYLAVTLIKGVGTPGWPTLVILLSFLSSTTILLISVIGEYIIQILQNTSSEKSYVITEVVGKK